MLSHAAAPSLYPGNKAAHTPPHMFLSLIFQCISRLEPLLAGRTDSGWPGPTRDI